MPIIKYGSTLTELIDALQKAQSKIDYKMTKGDLWHDED
jgi:hypothetical protein